MSHRAERSVGLEGIWETKVDFEDEWVLGGLLALSSSLPREQD